MYQRRAFCVQLAQESVSDNASRRLLESEMRTLVIMRYCWFSAMSRNSSLLLTAVSASMVFGAACSNRVSPVKFRKEYAAVAAAMERHSDGFSIDESPEASVLLNREWSLQAAWVTAYLEDHPSATAKQIERSVSDLGVNLQCNATLLAQGLYGIAIQKGEVGNVFVIAENHKHHRLVWNARLEAGHDQNSKLLAAWSARAAKGECRNKLKDEDWLNCGPLYGRFGTLPDYRFRYRVSPGFACAANAAKHAAFAHSSGNKPGIDGALDSIRNGHRPNMPGLANQVDDGPVVFPPLKVGKIQFCRLSPAQPATQEDSEQRSISLALERIRVRHLPELSCLLGGEPVTKANAEVLRPFDAPDASSKIRAEQTGISRFVCQATDGRKPAVNRARRKLT